jgi:predicted GNAT family acetyltransferase
MLNPNAINFNFPIGSIAMDFENITVINNEEKKRFEVKLEDELALMQYQRAGKNIIFTHTEVPVAFEGKGIAGKMAHTALEFAKENGLKIQALCPYVAHYVREHPEYHSITWGYENKS